MITVYFNRYATRWYRVKSAVFCLLLTVTVLVFLHRVEVQSIYVRSTQCVISFCLIRDSAGIYDLSWKLIVSRVKSVAQTDSRSVTRSTTLSVTSRSHTAGVSLDTRCTSRQIVLVHAAQTRDETRSGHLRAGVDYRHSDTCHKTTHADAVIQQTPRRRRTILMTRKRRKCIRHKARCANNTPFPARSSRDAHLPWRHVL